MRRTITIISTASGKILAQGIEGQNVVRLENNWYFDPSTVNQALLHETERIYVCPHKGECNWINLLDNEEETEDIAWVYRTVKPSYEYIKDQIAFYGGTRAATREEWEYA